MGEKLRISPDVRALIRAGRAEERDSHVQDREIPYGIKGETLRAEGYITSPHTNGGRSAVELERQYNGGPSVLDRIDKMEF